jgi:uncharacterized protein YegP (UPF0339 family)
MKFVVRKNAKGEFRWQAVGNNGEVMAVSERMTRKQSCLSAIDVVKKQAAAAEVVDKTDEPS